ncbi:hypothetical protein HYV88_04255 [Candidatus Woesearchaeota archaeon]|nr:hypothetical protein [Candidatus Woesearchaeota archaeon]
MIKTLLRRKKESGFRLNLVFGTVEKPLMILERYRVPNIEWSIEEAYRELKEHLSRSEDSSHTWGYFPQYCEDESQYPKCIALGNRLQEGLVNKLPFPESSMSLSFVRLADNRPVSEYGGMHVDVNPGIGHRRDPSVDGSLDILRLILNLGNHSRIIEHIPLTRDSLLKLGYDIPKDNYRILRFSKGTRRHRIEIPAREADTIYGLKFWSSQVPHAGITDDRGHFVAAFGCYANMDEYKI